MIIYETHCDKTMRFTVFTQWHGSSVKQALPFLIIELIFALIAVSIVVGSKRVYAEDAHVELGSLKELTCVASFMLAQQSRAAIMRYVQGVSEAVSIEEASNEFMRRVCMVLDEPNQEGLRNGLRRVLLGVLVEIVIEVRTKASLGYIGRERTEMALRRAVECGLLTRAEMIQATTQGLLVARSTMATRCQKKVTALLFHPRHQVWRDKWRHEPQNQPTINLVKLFSENWTRILDIALTMTDNLANIALPLHFMQLSRVVWATTMFLYPFQFAKSMGFSALGFQFLFCLGFFSVDFCNVDLENPFGFHRNAVPLEAILSRVEANSAVLLDVATAVTSDSEETPRHRARRYDMVYILEPLMKSAPLRSHHDQSTTAQPTEGSALMGDSAATTPTSSSSRFGDVDQKKKKAKQEGDHATAASVRSAVEEQERALAAHSSSSSFRRSGDVGGGGGGGGGAWQAVAQTDPDELHPDEEVEDTVELPGGGQEDEEAEDEDFEASTSFVAGASLSNEGGGDGGEEEEEVEHLRGSVDLVKGMEKAFRRKSLDTLDD